MSPSQPASTSGESDGPSQTTPTPRSLSARVSLHSAMLLVVAAALATAAWVKVQLFFDPNDSWSVDGPTIFVIAVVLCGLAIGGFRRYSPAQTLLHIGTAYFLTAGTVLLAEMHERLARYWLEVVVAATIAIPFAVQGVLLRRRPTTKCGKRRVKLWVEALVLANLNASLAVLGVTLSAWVAEATTSAVRQARDRNKASATAKPSAANMPTPGRFQSRTREPVA